MGTNEGLSFGIVRKILFVAIILIFVLAMVSFASKSEYNYVTIKFADESEISVLTSEINVGKILEENNIIVLPEQVVYPAKTKNIDSTKVINITNIDDLPEQEAEKVEYIETEEILNKYDTIVEKIIVEQIEIPFETITKDISIQGTDTTDKVVQRGQNGLKEIKYKVKYQNDIEMERIILSEEIIKEPVNKIVQISTKISARSGSRISGSTLAASVVGRTASVVNMNASAYCACMSCCGKTNGITSSGAKASAWYTVAAGKGIPIGTIIYIPALSNTPNGGWFVVQDRGGAISNTRIDIFMNSHGEALQFGRRNLECYLYY